MPLVENVTQPVLRPCETDAFGTIDGDDNLEATTNKPAGKHVAIHFIVFDEEQFWHVRKWLGS